jgi:anti-sigma regulatory factor (Ser/Thr protein kinase)
VNVPSHQFYKVGDEMGIGERIVVFLLNCVEAYVIYITAYHLSPMKKPPLWKILAFILLNAFQIHFIKSIIDSLVLGSSICIMLNILLLMALFGWKLANLAAISVCLIILFISEGTVFLFIYLLGVDMRSTAFGGSYVSAMCVILSRAIQCCLTYLFITRVEPKSKDRNVVLPRYVLLALIVVFLMVFCIYTVYGWALSDVSIPDWSLIIYILCTLLYIAMTLIILKIAVKNVRELEERKRIDMQGEFLLEVHQSLEQLKEYEHNYRKHLQTILDLTNNGLHADAERYYGELVNEFERAHMTVIANMPALSAVIQRIRRIAEKERIEFETELPSSVKTKTSELHLCVILSNLLDNAVEACEKVSGKRRISLHITNCARDDELCILVENTFDISSGRPHFRRNLPVTTKGDRELHGYGLRSVRRVVDMYGGVLDISYTEAGIFKVRIII